MMDRTKKLISGVESFHAIDISKTFGLGKPGHSKRLGQGTWRGGWQ